MHSGRQGESLKQLSDDLQALAQRVARWERTQPLAPPVSREEELTRTNKELRAKLAAATAERDSLRDQVAGLKELNADLEEQNARFKKKLIEQHPRDSKGTPRIQETRPSGPSWAVADGSAVKTETTTFAFVPPATTNPPRAENASVTPLAEELARRPRQDLGDMIAPQQTTSRRPKRLSMTSARAAMDSPAPQNPLEGPAVERVFACSMLTPSQVAEVRKVVQQIGKRARVMDVGATLPVEVTHVVTADEPNSQKALTALVSGRVVVNLAYVSACAAVGYWIAEEASDDAKQCWPRWPIRNLRCSVVRNVMDHSVEAQVRDVLSTGGADLVDSAADVRIDSGDALISLIRKFL